MRLGAANKARGNRGLASMSPLSPLWPINVASRPAPHIGMCGKAGASSGSTTHSSAQLLRAVLQGFVPDALVNRLDPNRP